VAKASGVSVEMLRYHEWRGLLPARPREDSSGYRAYSSDAVRVVRFVKRAQELGFAARRSMVAGSPSARMRTSARNRRMGAPGDAGPRRGRAGVEVENLHVRFPVERDGCYPVAT
jgi:hypothetical protein